MIKIVVGSLNKTKIRAVQSVFVEDEIGGASVPSHVLSQPIGEDMTRQGAINRAVAAQKLNADIGIGLEGGVTFHGNTLYLCNWGALATAEGLCITASGAKIALPESFHAPILAGEELSEIMDSFTERKNIRHHEGAIGIFTNGLLMREQMFAHVALLLRGQYLFSLT